MLRVLIGTGFLLMAVGFGAAGWQYWQSLPAAAVDTSPSSPAPGQQDTPQPQSWLISSTGGLVAPEDVGAFLDQDRFVPGRVLKVERQAMLADLLLADEKLPEAPFLEVLADIRAPKVSDGLCQVLTDTIASACAVQVARVVEGSVDPVAGTAMFRLELVYRLKPAADALPDLATRVLGTDEVRLEVESNSAGTESADAALAALVGRVTEACAAEGMGEGCRPLRMEIRWSMGRPVSARAEIGWLDPLPEGMFVAPPLDTRG